MRALLVLVLLCASAQARNTIIALDDPNRDWFSRPAIHRCCDYADGKFVEFRLVQYGTGFEIKIEGEWVAVPDWAILKGERNPYLTSLAWYRPDNRYDGEGNLLSKGWYVRCFIVGAGL